MDGWSVNNEWRKMWKEKITDYCSCLEKMKKTMKNFIHDRRAEGLHWTRDFMNARWTATIDTICEVGLPSTSPHPFMVCCLIKQYASVSSHVQTANQYTRSSRCIQSEVCSEPWCRGLSSSVPWIWLPTSGRFCQYLCTTLWFSSSMSPLPKTIR
jgi:hypothetical protein